MPQFFQHAPVVVDLDGLGDARVDLARLAEVLRRRHLVPVAVRNASERQKQRAISAGWGVLQTNSPAQDRPAAPPAAAPPDVNERAPGNLTIRTPVRSGQVIYAVGGDLVVLAPVSSGAELIADGNIHVYAPLRGRALAGAHDNPEASIFCMNMGAEFLSVDGRYLLAEEIPQEARGKPARAHLRGDDLIVTLL
jgi:septum site-determining protein MinC